MRKFVEIPFRSPGIRSPLVSTIGSGDFNSKWGRIQDLSQLLHYTQVGLVTLYVDGMVVSGPRENRSKFWHELGKHLKLEELRLVNRVLVRNRIVRGDGAKFEMDDFTQEC